MRCRLETVKVNLFIDVFIIGATSESLHPRDLLAGS